MSAPTARVRLLLLGLAVAAMLGLKYWPEAEEPSWAPNPNYARAAHGTPATANAGADAGTAPRAELGRPDSGIANQAGFGVLVMQRDQPAADTGSFYYVEIHDSTRTLASMGFISQSALLDSTARFAALAESGAKTELAVASRSTVDSAMRAPTSECTAEIPTPVRQLAGASSPWKLALMSGVEPALPDGEWNARHATAADRAEALRLARSLPAPPPPLSEDAPAPVPAPLPITFELKSLHRFTTDGTDYLVADVLMRYEERRAGSADADQLSAQRLFIAERNATTASAPFTVVWSDREGAWSDEPTTETPVMMLRLGAERLLTLYTSGQYKDGGGGLFVSRVGKQQWRTVASWYGGC
jgi:hypothetical protein